MKSHQFEKVDRITKSEVSAGDHITIETNNSQYHLRSLGDNLFSVKGGWFDQDNDEPSAGVGIKCCGLGGELADDDLIAALGEQLQFSNNITTSRVRRIKLLRLSRYGGGQNS